MEGLPRTGITHAKLRTGASYSSCTTEVTVASAWSTTMIDVLDGAFVAGEYKPPNASAGELSASAATNEMKARTIDETALAACKSSPALDVRMPRGCRRTEQGF